MPRAVGEIEAGEHRPLKRSLSLPLLALYGIGVTIGAGIYVLVGKVAGIAGYYTPLTFLIAAVLAGFTACSYAELGARYPRSAGAAVYVYEGFHRRWISLVVGLMVVTTGVVSSAVVIIGFVGYLNVLIPMPDWIVITALVAVLAALTAWGITESVTVAAIITVLEVGGLLIVIAVGVPYVAGLDSAAVSFGDFVPPGDVAVWAAILSGALLAFFAFIGFEDMANVAEEVKRPEINLPLGIFITIAVTVTLYFGIAIVAILALPLDVLSASDAPLSLMFETFTGREATLVSLIALVAVLNGAMIQMIMASRVLFGSARAGWLPAFLGYVHPATRTPVVATAVVALVTLFLALALPIVELARFTSYVILGVFTLVNAALVVLKVRRTSPAAAGVEFPLWVPAVGAAISAALALANLAGGGGS